jgi:hypothetical protein
MERSSWEVNDSDMADTPLPIPFANMENFYDVPSLTSYVTEANIGRQTLDRSP